MDYIAIKNDGHIVKEDLMLIGSSTKRGDTSKIGMFGSGWKYAIAYFLRNNCKVTIFSGNTEIKVDTTMVKHRDMDVQVITIDGERTSITTSMGPNWTAWMALREVVSNAIDEGGFKLETDSSMVKSENSTIIYIGLNDELREVIYNYNNYFAFDRPNAIVIDINETKSAKFYLRNENEGMSIYRKGIKCNDYNYPTKYDVDFSDISINESRLTNRYDIDESIMQVMRSNNLTLEVLIAILSSDELHDRDTIPNYPTDHIINLFRVGIKYGLKVTSQLMVKLFGEVLVGRSIIIPDKWYNKLVEEGIVEGIEALSSKLDDFVEKDAMFDVVKVKEILNRFIDVDVVTGVFGNDDNYRFVDGVVYLRHNLNSEANIVAGVLYTIGRSNLTELIKKHEYTS